MPHTASEIEIPTVTVRLNSTSDTIRFTLDIPKRLKRYFLRNQFYVRYNPDINLNGVPNSTLTIPIISTIIPISWAVGFDLSVPELDINYLKSLDNTQSIFKSLKYRFAFTGTVKVQSLVSSTFVGKRTCILFSYGVDSLTSYLKHKEEKPDLISIWGVPDIPLSEHNFWHSTFENVLNLAAQDTIQAFQVETDIFRNINTDLLEQEYGVWWYPLVANGLALPGLCAPIAAIRGIGTIIRASSFTKDYKTSFGNRIDNSQFWSGVKVVHDGYDLSRQEKLHYLCQDENLSYLTRLRVCNETANSKKINCGRCEKCLRTMMGLLVEGIDPNLCNIFMDNLTARYIRECFEKGKISDAEGSLFFWKDIQRHITKQIDADIRGSRDLLNWFRNLDLSKYRTNKLRHFFWRLYLLHKGGRIKLTYLNRKVQCHYHIIRDIFNT